MQKPTKEQEEALKDVLENECWALFPEFEEEPLTEKIHDFFVYAICGRIRTAYFKVKCFFQRTFRKSHMDDLNIWVCNLSIVTDSLKKVKAFRAMNRHGYPNDLNNMEEWDKILDEIILKLELWIKLFENDGYESMCIEHGWEYPWTKRIEYKSVSYVFNGKDGSSVSTEDLDYDIKNLDYAYCGRQVSYFNGKAYKDLHQMAEEGLLLFAKWLPNMWD
jgi:hypothetical protein